MSPSSFQPSDIAGDGVWLSHRFDPATDTVLFKHLTREERRSAVFLTDEYLPDKEIVSVLRQAAVSHAGALSPLRFIFHSGFCCSTMLARAFDVDDLATDLREPMILNDLVGWKRRGASGREVARVLDDILKLLARPAFGANAVIVKPSNVVNSLALAILAMRPDAVALVLHAPLRVFLRSIAKKGLDGRLWAREALIGFITDNMVDLGFSSRDYLGHTDLQAAAVGWLAQQSLFGNLIERYGAPRVRSLDSDALLKDPRRTVSALAEHFALPVDQAMAARLAAGPAFTRHSKDQSEFSAVDREAEHANAALLHADEVEKVAVWAEAVARNAGLSLQLEAPLLP